eukprot:361095-Chlamydomonas_euryale.AAC.16
MSTRVRKGADRGPNNTSTRSARTPGSLARVGEIKESASERGYQLEYETLRDSPPGRWERVLGGGYQGQRVLHRAPAAQSFQPFTPNGVADPYPRSPDGRQPAAARRRVPIGLSWRRVRIVPIFRAHSERRSVHLAPLTDPWQLPPGAPAQRGSKARAMSKVKGHGLREQVRNVEHLVNTSECETGTKALALSRRPLLGMKLHSAVCSGFRVPYAAGPGDARPRCAHASIAGCDQPPGDH